MLLKVLFTALALGWLEWPYNVNSLCAGAASWQREINAVVNSESSLTEHHAVLGLIAQVVKLSYTGNYDAGTTLDAKGQWKYLAHATTNLHAVAFSNAGRVIIGFRGTQSEIDKCADWELFTPWKPQPLKCKELNHAEYDYRTQAAQFVKQVVIKFCTGKRLLRCNPKLLFTGHSLGAALAEVLSVQSEGKIPAIVFASPGVGNIVLRNNKQDVSCAIQIANPYDPVVRLSQNFQLGVACTYQNISEPVFCAICFSIHKDGSAREFFCAACMEEVHLFKHYLTLLDSKFRPICHQLTPRLSRNQE